MGVIAEQGTAGPAIRLEGVVDIGSAAELKARLLEALGSGAPTELMLEGLTGLDVTTLQLLTAAETAARIRGAAWRRTGAMPESLRAAAAEAGWPALPFAGDGA